MNRRSVVPEEYQAVAARFGFSPAVRVGNLIICSGQVGEGAPDDLERQMVSAWTRVGEVLRAAGAGFGDVVEVVSYHVGLRQQLDTFVNVKARFVPGPVLPAWTAVGVTELSPPGRAVEIKVTAVVPDRPTDATATRKPLGTTKE